MQTLRSGVSWSTCHNYTLGAGADKKTIASCAGNEARFIKVVTSSLADTLEICYFRYYLQGIFSLSIFLSTIKKSNLKRSFFTWCSLKPKIYLVSFVFHFLKPIITSQAYDKAFLTVLFDGSSAVTTDDETQLKTFLKSFYQEYGINDAHTSRLIQYYSDVFNEGKRIFAYFGTIMGANT